MAGMRGDIAVAEQRALVDVRIELGFHLLVFEVARPAHEIRNGARRPVAVEDFGHQTLRLDIGRDRGQSVGGGARQQTMRRLVTIDRPADEIMRARITHLDDQPGHDGRRIDEGSRTRAVPTCGAARST